MTDTTVYQETTIHRYIGHSTGSKPTGVPIGSTYFAWDTAILYITYDGTNWVIKEKYTTS